MSRLSDSVIGELRRDLLRMGGLCESILDKSLRSIWNADATIAAEIEGDDLPIDRLDVAVDEGVLKALALQAPVAEDLRNVLAIKMVATDLERVGDLSRNIAKSGIRLSAGGEIFAPPEMLIQLAREAQSALRSSLDAFGRGDPELARAVLTGDDAIDDLEDEVIRNVLSSLDTHPALASRELDVIWIAKHLERVADHATNIAEQVILVAEAKNVKHASKLAEM
jgi:phosphate transport system protein